MDIMVKVTDLLWKVREMNRAEMDYVTLSVFDEEDMGDGDIIPKSLHFSAFKESEPYLEIDYEDIEEAKVDRDEGSIAFTNIK